MKNKYIMLLASFLVLTLTLNLTSAILCIGANGYYNDCNSYNTYAPRYGGVSFSISSPRVGVSINTGYGGYNSYASNYNLGYYSGFLSNYAYGRNLANSIYVGSNRGYSNYGYSNYYSSPYSSYSYSPYSRYSYSSPYSTPYSSYSYGYNKYAYNPFSGSSGPAAGYGASYGSVYVGSRSNGYSNPFSYGW